MQPRSSTEVRQPNTKRTERAYDRLPLQTQGQTPIQLYSIILIFDCIAERKTFDVAFRVMDFMDKNNLKPSDALIEEYRQSNTTKALNQLTSEELVKKGYDKMKKIYRRKIIKNN